MKLFIVRSNWTLIIREDDRRDAPLGTSERKTAEVHHTSAGAGAAIAVAQQRMCMQSPAGECPQTVCIPPGEDAFNSLFINKIVSLPNVNTFLFYLLLTSIVVHFKID